MNKINKIICPKFIDRKQNNITRLVNKNYLFYPSIIIHNTIFNVQMKRMGFFILYFLLVSIQLKINDIR